MLLIQTNRVRNEYIKNVMDKVKSYEDSKYGISAIEFEAPSNEDLLIEILKYFYNPTNDDHNDRSNFGIFFLIYFAYFISKKMSFTNVWPHIDDYIKGKPTLNFLNRNDQHKYIKDCIYLACTTFNLKHSFYHDDNAFYRNTFFLQIGLTDQFDHINVWLLNDIVTPISIRMLIDSRDQNFSLSFYKTWYDLKKVRRNSNLSINQSQLNNPFFRRFQSNLTELNRAIKRPIHHPNKNSEHLTLMEYIHEDEEIENLRYFYLSNIIQKNNQDLLFEIESVLDRNGYYELNMLQDQLLSHESTYSLYIDNRYQGDFSYDQKKDLFKLTLISSYSKISILNPKNRTLQLNIYDNDQEKMIYQEEITLLAENDILIAMDNTAIYNLKKLYKINSPCNLLLSPNYDLFDQDTLVSHRSIVLGDLKFYQELDHHKKFKLVSKNSQQDYYHLEFNTNKIQMIDDIDDIESEQILITITRINEDKDLILKVNRIQNGNVYNPNLKIVKWTINQLDLELSNYNQNQSTLVIENIDMHQDILYHVLTNKKHTIKILNSFNKKESFVVKAFINFHKPSRHLFLKNKTNQKIKKVKNNIILSLSHLKDFLIYVTIPSFTTYLENLKGLKLIELVNEMTDEKLYDDLKLMRAYSLDSFEYSGLGDQIWLFENEKINRNMNLEIWQTGYINLKLSDHILPNQETEQETHNHIYLSIQLSNMIQQQEYIILWIDEDDCVHMSEKLEYEILEDRIWVKGVDRNTSKLISIFAKIDTDQSKVKLNYIGSYVNFESDFFSNDYPYLLLISFFPFFSHKIKIFDREFSKYNHVSYHYNINPHTRQLNVDCHVPDFDPKAFLNVIDDFEKTKSGVVKICDENDETFDFNFDFIFSTQFQIALKHLKNNIRTVILPIL